MVALKCCLSSLHLLFLNVVIRGQLLVEGIDAQAAVVLNDHGLSIGYEALRGPFMGLGIG